MNAMRERERERKENKEGAITNLDFF